MDVSTFIVVLLAFACPAACTLIVARNARGEEMLEDEEERFEVSPLMLVFLSSVNLVGMLFIAILVMIPNKDIYSIGLFSTLAGVFFILGALGVRRARRSYVLIDARKLTYVNGKKKSVVLRCSIKRVYALNGTIVVDTGTIPRMVIPMIYSKSNRILDILQGG